MPLLTPKNAEEKTKIKLMISKNVLEETQQYMKYANFKSLDDMIEAALTYIINKDKEFKDYLAK